MKTYEGNLVPKDVRIGIVVARFNEFITSKLTILCAMKQQRVSRRYL